MHFQNQKCEMDTDVLKMETHNKLSLHDLNEPFFLVPTSFSFFFL